MMKVRVLLFAVLAQRAGRSELWLELPEGATVGQAVEALVREHAAIGEFDRQLATAVDLEYVGRGEALAPGQTLALIPPVSGG